jgi:hypothetical protein
MSAFETKGVCSPSDMVGLGISVFVWVIDLGAGVTPIDYCLSFMLRAATFLYMIALPSLVCFSGADPWPDMFCLVAPLFVSFAVSIGWTEHLLTEFDESIRVLMSFSCYYFTEMLCGFIQDERTGYRLRPGPCAYQVC